MAELTLEVVEGADAGRQIDLDNAVEIGRDESVGLPLAQDSQASRRHARVTPHGDLAIVEDLGSTNGTFVNDQAIHTQHPIRPGDRVRIGLSVVQLRSAAQVLQRASAVVPRPHVPTPPPAQPQPQYAATAAPPQAAAPQAAPPPAAAPQAAPPAAAPPPAAQPQQFAPGFRAPETPAGYVPPEALGDPEAESDYAALGRLADTRVKPRGYLAAFALLAAAAIALILIFGLQ